MARSWWPIQTTSPSSQKARLLAINPAYRNSIRRARPAFSYHQSVASQPGIFSAAWEYWTNRCSRSGFFGATGDLVGAVWGFLRDSTPSRLRSRFGDADYDWDYRVNTTSGAVGWRDRLLGVFNSPYQPTEAALFHEMIDELAKRTSINFAEFTFIDLGSGKGRALLMASDYPFRKIVGVE